MVGRTNPTRSERDHAQKVSVEKTSVHDYNLHIKKPQAHCDPETLPEELTSTEAEV